MTNFSVRKFFAAAAILVCLPFMPNLAAATPAANLPDFTDLVDKVGPAVVNIRTTTHVSSSALQRGQPPGTDQGDMSEFFRRFFGIPLPQAPNGSNAPRGDNGGSADNPDTPDNNDAEQSAGVGSGFILSQDGYVMTNAHVVDDADTIYVTLTDKREFKAKLIGEDERTDVAIVKIEASDLPTVTIGDSDKVTRWRMGGGHRFAVRAR